MLCAEVNKRSEKVRGRECIEARRNYTTSKVIMLFVCGCYESEVSLRVIRGVFIPLILLKNISEKEAKQNETGINIPEFVQ